MISFTWALSDAGYAWNPLPNGSNNPQLLPLKPWPTQEYEPLRLHTGLFRQFAELTEEPDAILRFANEFGPLCRPLLPPEKQVPSAAAKRGKSAKEIESSAPLLGSEETLSFWRGQILAMRTAVALWDEIREERNDPAELARVAEAVELGCRDRVDSRFHFDRAQLECGWARLPRDLIGAIWVQFSDAVSGNKRYRRCPAPNCGKWFELSDNTRGRDPNHCSGTCKQRMSRLRKQVLELSKKKWTPSRIAKELGVPVETVKPLVPDPPPDSDGEQKMEERAIDL